MIKISDKAMCSGCGVCKDVCPVAAINMVSDKEGFLYPQVNLELCIDCGICESKCPIINNVPSQGAIDSIVAYAAYTKDDILRLHSSSGGIFTHIATNIVKKGGVVFGAMFDSAFVLRHKFIDNLDDLSKLRGSKYVQSNIGDSYLQAKDYLDRGVKVLFTGTPCQIAGLYSFLEKDYDNLVTQDIVCHGVPSPMVWQKYIDYRQNSVSSKLDKISFRDKSSGWKTFSMRMEYSNGKRYIGKLNEDRYMRAFLSNMSLRPSCYRCSFKGKIRQSDITLADFWGVEKVCPEMFDNAGTSLLILNSEKGRDILEEIRNELNLVAVNFEDAIMYNSAMIKSVNLNEDREKFLTAVEKHGFKKASKYVRISALSLFKGKMKKMIKQRISHI